MAHTPSIMSLYLRYRLWIAEMNSDITVLRIFDDYLSELTKKNDPALNQAVSDYHQKFIDFRKEIDELKHEMHLVKMNLAAYERDAEAGNSPQPPLENHEEIKERYNAYCSNFEAMKKAFQLLDSK